MVIVWIMSANRRNMAKLTPQWIIIKRQIILLEQFTGPFTRFDWRIEISSLLTFESVAFIVDSRFDCGGAAVSLLLAPLLFNVVDAAAVAAVPVVTVVVFAIADRAAPVVVVVAVTSTLLFPFDVSHLSGAFGWPISDGAILDLLIDDIDKTRRHNHTKTHSHTFARNGWTAYARPPDRGLWWWPLTHARSPNSLCFCWPKWCEIYR